jgi:FkbM family methyltransferase
VRAYIKKLFSKLKLNSNAATVSLPDIDWFETEIDDIKWRLYLRNQIDKEVALHVFEPVTTGLIKKVIKPGMRVLDVGANIGYYTTIIGKIIGADGELWAFEPVSRYRERNLWNVKANHLENRVHILDFALSDQKTTAVITMNHISASMHWVSPTPSPDVQTESIKLDTLDNVDKLFTLPKIDFIKIDTDGHEPFVFRGAKEFFKKQKPLMMVEFTQLSLDTAESDVRELKEIIESLGYCLFSEKTLEPFRSRLDFLLECGNFTHSANVWAVPEGNISSLSQLF